GRAALRPERQHRPGRRDDDVRDPMPDRRPALRRRAARVSEAMSTAPEPTGTVAAALENAARLLRLDPLLAAEQAVEILKVVPAHPGATLLLGSARRAAGNPAAALAVLQPLAATHPTWAAAHYELGLTLSHLESHDDSLHALRRAVELQPDLPDAWREIGDRLALRGDTE